MSNSPYFTKKDAQLCKDALRYYKDYLIKEGIKRDHPKHFDDAHTAFLHIWDLVQYWERYPSIGDVIQLVKPENAIERNILDTKKSS